MYCRTFLVRYDTQYDVPVRQPEA